MTASATETEREPEAPAESRWSGLASVLSVLLPAFAALSIYLWRIGTPALWTDEGATIRDISKSWSELAATLAERDAVLGLYFVALKGWSWYDDGEGWLRLPSAVAMAGAVLVAAALARRWWGPRSAVAVGALLAVSPVLSRYGQEARPYAIAVFLAVLSTWFLERAIARPDNESAPPRRRGWWAGYAVVIALLGLMHLLALLILAAHVIFVVVRRRGPDHNGPLGPWIIATASGLVPCLVLGAVAFTQRGQISWIEDPTIRAVGEAYVYVVGREDGIALFALLVGLALAGPGAHLLRRDRVELGLVAWFVLPVVVLAGVGLLTPIFSARYLLPSGIALVLLAGAALRRAPIWLLAAVVGLAVLFAWPQHPAMRAVDGHGPDVRTLAALLADSCQPGDAVKYNASTVTPVPYYLRDAPCEPEPVFDKIPAGVERLWVINAPWEKTRSFADAGFELAGSDGSVADVPADIEVRLWVRR